MPKPADPAKRARKAAAKAAARRRAKRISSGEVPGYIFESRSAWQGPARPGAGRTPAEQPPTPTPTRNPTAGRARTPPSSGPLPELEREHYADNARPLPES